MAAAENILASGETKFRREFLITALALAGPLAILMVANPAIDLTVSETIRGVCSDAWCRGPALVAVRYAFIGVFTLVCFATLAVTVRVLVESGRWFGATQARCWFVVACLAVGPGVVANLVLKDNLGRARPREVIEFGGTKAFTPAFVPSNQCPDNCSFVSGEASSMFASFFALALVLPQYRMALIAAGIATGSIAGAIRMLQGAHFLSDVLFAGIFMALTVSVLHMAVIGFWRNSEASRARRRRNAWPDWIALARLASSPWSR
jgi:lipid A 4'-phosphatase